MQQSPIPKMIIFVNSVRAANFVAVFLLKQGYLAFVLHEERHVEENKQIYERYLSRKLDIIVTTDSTLVNTLPADFMINYELPTEVEKFALFIQRFKKVRPVAKSVKVFSFFDCVENSSIAYQVKKVCFLFVRLNDGCVIIF